MPKPTDPTKTIIKNEYYSNGLSSGEIYNYYMDNKNLIIEYADGRPILLFYKFDQYRDFIVKRNIGGKKIVLTKDNYEEIITGYNVSLSVETEYRDNRVKELIVDIDPISKKVTEKELKNCIVDVSILFPEYKHKIITNSADGYHIRFLTDKIVPRIPIFKNAEKVLVEKLGNKYLINDKSRYKDVQAINIDLVAMQRRGTITVVNALCRNGLICKNITNNYLTYTRKDSIVI